MDISTKHVNRWHHSHLFDEGNPQAEVRTLIAVGVTAAMMVVEIVAGWFTGSMALLADGWHMATHALALGVAVLAYRMARKWAMNPRFSFGSWKVEVLSSFASACMLLMIAVWMLGESVVRLYSPVNIDVYEAVVIAVIGLIVNLVCAVLLHQSEGGHAHHGHSHGHKHGHGHGSHAHHDHHSHDHPHQAHASHAHRERATGGEDLNLKAAYVHVLTDAATSVLAIAALLGAQATGLNWLDPLMGVLGAVLVGRWSIGLIQQSGSVLMDQQAPEDLLNDIRASIQNDGDAEVSDLHVWQVGQSSYACIAVVVADQPQTPDAYRQRIGHRPELVHMTIEVNPCERAACL